MAPPVLLVDRLSFDTPTTVDGTPLKMCVNRYSSASCAADGFTLLLAHATGTHKEQWEPMLEHLFQLQAESGQPGVIREAWSFELHTHGDSGVLNKDALKKLPKGTSLSDWAEGVAAFVTQHLIGHRLIPIGHSAGTSVAMYSTKCYGSSSAPYQAIILVEPPLIDRHVFYANLKDREKQTGMLMKTISIQRSEWESRETAYQWFSSKYPWKVWDQRSRVILVNHGLRPLHDGVSTGPVVAKCDKRFEAANYSDFEATFQATEQIEKVCNTIPIHIIFGEKNDLVPKYGQDSILDASKGRRAASVARIPGAGHMVVQQQPALLARAIFAVLCGSNTQSRL